MAVLSALAPLHVRATWRELRSGGARTLSALAACAAGILALRRVLIVAGPATLQAGAGECLQLEMLLLVAAIGWWPVIGFAGGTPLRGSGLVPARLRTQPLRHRTLFGLSAVSLLLQPGCWIAAAAVLRAGWCLLSLGSPGWGALATGLFALLGAWGGWFFVLCTALARVRRFGRILATAATVALLVAIAVSWAAGVQIQHRPEGWILVRAAQRVLLLDPAKRAGLFVELAAASPAGWAVRAAVRDEPAQQCAALAGLLTLFVAATVWGHGALLRADHVAAQQQRTRPRARALGVMPFLRPRLGAAVARELRMLLRTPDTVLGFVAGLLAALLAGLWHGGSMLLVWIGLGFVLLGTSSFAFNSFGLDGRGIDRVRLLPLASADIVAAKNTALVLVLALQAALLIAAALWRFGLVFGAAALFGALNGAVAYALLGNITSLHFPAARDPDGYEGSEQSGGVLGSLAALGVGVLGCIAGVELTHRGLWTLLVAQTLMLAAGCIAYARLLPRMGTHFDARYEALHQRLTAHDS